MLTADEMIKILNALNIGVEVFDTELKFLFINEYEKKMSYGGRDVVGENCMKYYSEQELEECGYLSVLRTGEPVVNRIITYLDARGSRRVATINAYPLEEKGKITGLFAYGEDITGISMMTAQQMTKHKSLGERYYSIHDIIGISPQIRRVKEQIAVAALNDANVMITGETGTGKEMVAQSIYTLYRERIGGNCPFVAFNCAAVPEGLLESVLFGTVKGSFTGAENHAGLFEQARDGVLFLDEINLLPTTLQGKLLRAIQEKRIRRIGSEKEVSLSFKLITSSNRDSIELLQEEDFRTDLFYRLNVLSVNLPPLRDREGDVILLAQHFLEEAAAKAGKESIGIDSEASNWMMLYDWPGNVRELKNMIERAVYNARSSHLGLADLKEGMVHAGTTRVPGESQPNSKNNGPESGWDLSLGLKEIVGRVEKAVIEEALSQNQGNISRTARKLDLPKQTFYNKLTRYGLRPKNRF